MCDEKLDVNEALASRAPAKFEHFPWVFSLVVIVLAAIFWR